MTVRIPKWLLWAIVAGLVAAAIASAFLLGRSSGGDGSPVAGSPSRGPDEDPGCSRVSAEQATLSSVFADTIRGHGTAQARANGYAADGGPAFFTDVATDYQVALLRCSDVTGDGDEEMIVGIGAGASRRVFSWAVFEAGETGRWELLFDREGSQVSSIEAGNRSIVVRTPTFGTDDPLCCPSGYKSTRIEFRDGKFEPVSSGSPAEREVVVEEGRVTRLGELDPFRDSSIQAVAEFGAPTSIVDGSDSVCHYGWGDLGLSIDFANFGGGDACGLEGRMANFELAGAPAMQAGWHTNEGAEVGMKVGELRNLYPGARENDGELILVETPSPIGAGGTLAVMTAFAGGGRAWSYRFYVGAAGE